VVGETVRSRMEGSEEGPAVGSPVGSELGLPVLGGGVALAGFNVGIFVGFKVGVNVGSAVGPDEGIPVGPEVVSAAHVKQNSMWLLPKM